MKFNFLTFTYNILKPLFDNLNLIIYFNKGNYLISFLNSHNSIFFIFNIIILIFFVNISYKLLYNNIIHYILFEFTHELLSILKEFKSYIINYQFEKIHNDYYKQLLKLNLKQYLIGSGIILFFISIYLIIDLYIQLKLNSNVSLTFNLNHIYDTSYVNKNNINFNIKIYFLNFIIVIFLIYIIFHILFGIYNIFYDYLPDSALLLFLLSSYILYLCLFQVGVIYLTKKYLNLLLYLLPLNL
jgi:hypothetical protein